MDPKITFKCKPTYQFQSIEFEVAASIDEIPKVKELYKTVLDQLIEIAPEQDKKSAAKPTPAEPLATPGQKATMDKFGIQYGPETTKKQAQALIQASIDGIGE